MAKMVSEGDGGGIIQSGRDITAGEVEQTLLPVLLRNLSDIEDPRQAKKVKHQLSALLLYGILMFVYQMGSRREATRKMTQPQFAENLRLVFPEVEDLPHHDTLQAPPPCACLAARNTPAPLPSPCQTTRTPPRTR